MVHGHGFGMFIHWSMDSQVGAVISHSMAGASEDILRDLKMTCLILQSEKI
jgi:hypothetical protein